MDFTGSPGRILNHAEKHRQFQAFTTTSCSDTPKHAPAEMWLLPDTPSLYVI